MVLFGFNTVDDSMEIVSSIEPNPSKTYYENDEIINYVLPNLMGPDPQTGEESNLQMSENRVNLIFYAPMENRK